MFRNMLPLILVILAASNSGSSQVVLSGPQRCKLRIIVTTDRQEPIKEANVELMDAVGLSSAMSTKITDSDGQVDFNTWTGLHRVRVYGVQIHEYAGDFEIAPRESSHLERITVRPKLAPMASLAPGKVIATVRLKIPPRAEKEYQTGSKSLQKQDWQEAGKHFEAAIALYRDYDLAYNGLGVAHMNQGNVEAARQAFQKAIERNKTYAAAERNLARILIAEHNYQDADALLKVSLATEPLNAWALTHAAYAELQLRKFSEAMGHARKAHDVPHQGLASVHIVAARALEATHQPEEALAEYRRYLEEDSNGRDAARAREAVARLSSSASPKPPTTPTPLRPPK
ncbi:MAG: tetratricopeptide repeat protein [Acidobacteria bacterium]|nr:tetratricopeptide repeat protein [Acidobacteriota bacterium]